MVSINRGHLNLTDFTLFFTRTTDFGAEAKRSFFFFGNLSLKKVKLPVIVFQ